MLMDKRPTENDLKIEKLESRFNEGDFKTAKDICDKIEFRKIKDEKTLTMAYAVYEKNKEYNTAKELLKKAYKYSPVQKRLLFDLCFVCIQDDDLAEAIVFYKEFCENFPVDQRKELLKYEMLKKKKASPEQLIRILEDYLSNNLEEKWLYELALQYEREENTQNLILCLDKIVDMFGLSEYGKLALQLKQKYEKLTDEQKALIENAMNKRNEENKKEFFEEEKKATHEDITPEIKKEDKTQEEDNSDLLFNDLPRTNVGLEDTYIQDTDEYFKEDDKQFVSAFASNGDSHKDNSNKDPLTEDIELKSDKEEQIKEEKIDADVALEQAVEKIKKQQEKLKQLENNTENKNQEENKILTDEQKEIINKFNERKRKYILNVTEEEKKMILDNIKYHMIIESMTREQGMKIATEELNFIHKQMRVARNIAKTNAYNINEKGFNYYKEKIGANDLLIENAGRLTDRAIDDIEEFMINNGNKNIICLIDIMNNFDQMVLRRPAFSERFDIISDVNVKNEIPNNNKMKEDFPERAHVQNNIQYDDMFKEEKKHEEKPSIEKNVSEEKSDKIDKQKEIETFALMCRNYATSIDCVIPGKSMSALYEKIESLIEKNIPLTKDNASIVIEEAADKAEKQKWTFSKKYDENDCLILKEEHFK